MNLWVSHYRCSHKKFTLDTSNWTPAWLRADYMWQMGMQRTNHDQEFCYRYGYSLNLTSLGWITNYYQLKVLWDACIKFSLVGASGFPSYRLLNRLHKCQVIFTLTEINVNLHCLDSDRYICYLTYEKWRETADFKTFTLL